MTDGCFDVVVGESRIGWKWLGGEPRAVGRHQDGSGLASVRLGGPKLKIVGGNGGELQ